MSSSLNRRTTSVTICQVVQQNSSLFKDMHKPVNATIQSAANETLCECVVSCAGRHHVCKESEGLHCLWMGPCWLVNGLQVQTTFSVSISRQLGCDWKSRWCFKSSCSVCVSPAGRVGLWKDVFTVSMNDKFDAIYRQRMGKSDLTFDFGLWGAPSPSRCVPHSPLHRSTSVQLTSSHSPPKPSRTSTFEV